MRLVAYLALMGVGLLAMAQHAAPPSPAAAAKMRESAERLLATLPEQQRSIVTRPFDDGDRIEPREIVPRVIREDSYGQGR